LPHVNIILRINYTKEILSNCIHIIDNFPKEIRKKIFITLVKVRQNTYPNAEIKNNIFKQQIELEKTFKEAGFYVINPNFENICYTCYADLFNEAVINYDGRVFKCTSVDYENAKEEGILNDQGEIIWNENIFAKRIAKSTFDNKECLKCEVLPICTGRCSSNTFLSNETCTKCTIKSNVRKRLNDKMNLFYYQDYKLCHISQI